MKDRSPTRNLVWAGTSLALLIPYAAILHHGVFYRPTCMLKPFGPDYDLATLSRLLTRDPSLGLALGLCLLTYAAGLHSRWGRCVQLAAWPLWIGFLPLSLWVWDIPFAGRPICTYWHDGRLVLPLIGRMHGRYLYAFGLGAALLLTLRNVRDERVRSL